MVVKRGPLNRDVVLAAAIAIADADGIRALSMRRLGQALGVEAMSLYHHVAGKEDLFDGMVDAVFAEIELPREGEEWKGAMRARAASARAALTRHPWASGLMNSRTSPGLATLRHHDAVIGCLRAAGFSVAMVAHAFSAIDAYVYGFVLQELSLPFNSPEESEQVAQEMAARMPADAFPHLAQFTVEHVLRPGYDFGEEFEFGLELILEGLGRAILPA